ncbi:Nocturnin [Fasciola gigantica]|uniref:Nocturnin n=1 Tax=Fasciola gigantica TaxID=46835 RepID=A0A504YZ05_FASGI|nr:Nocturnin [Fasciola gigantica]
MNCSRTDTSSPLRRSEFYDRSFISLGGSNCDVEVPSIRIMQWNILAQGFVPLDEFVHCPSAILDMESRCTQIAAEVNRFGPDVVCLQEADVHEQVLRHLNKTHDIYELQFRPKDNSPCLGIPDNMGPDGVAIIFRSDRFVLVHCEDLPLDESNNRTALLCTLRPKDPKIFEQFPLIYMVSVHLKAKAQFTAVRLSQGTFLCNALRTISRRAIVNDYPIPPLFVCGDFNAEPYEPVIQLMRDVACPHGWELKSVYAEAYGGSEPDYTTWKIRGGKRLVQVEEACRTIDYIWYSSNVLRPLGVWSLPTKEEIGPYGLPSTIFPSDHLNLVADFSLNRVSEG